VFWVKAPLGCLFRPTASSFEALGPLLFCCPNTQPYPSSLLLFGQPSSTVFCCYLGSPTSCCCCPPFAVWTAFAHSPLLVVAVILLMLLGQPSTSQFWAFTCCCPTFCYSPILYCCCLILLLFGQPLASIFLHLVVPHLSCTHNTSNG
jgi:hypothetical protein